MTATKKKAKKSVQATRQVCTGCDRRLGVEKNFHKDTTRGGFKKRCKSCRSNEYYFGK